MSVFSLGYRPDPKEGHATDFAATELLGIDPAPAMSSNRELIPFILDQGQLGSCTANAAAYALRAAMIRSGFNPTEFISRLFLYFLARASFHESDLDEGTFIRAIFAAANKFGFCPESLWAYSDNKDPNAGPVLFSKMPSQAAFRAAFDQHQPTTYRRIFETGYDRVDVIKRALGAKHLVVYGTDVTKAFCADMTANGGKPLDPPGPNDEIAGGHAMCAAEHDSNGIAGPQSWSTAYNPEGLGDVPPGWLRLSWDYMAWTKTEDLWIVEYAPKFDVAPDTLTEGGQP